MNHAQILDHFDRICDAPDAIPRLRRFILDLAVRGKLVQQDPSDEPASEFLKRIQGEKERLVKDRRQKPELLLRLDLDVPFLVPDSWAWVHLDALAEKITDGEHLSPNKTTSGPVRVQPNSWIWLYATSPRNCLEGRALIRQVIIDTPANIWRRFKNELGITRSEFFSYVGSRCLISAIQLTKIEQFANPLRLSLIRAAVASFHPPQFYLRLTRENRVYQLLKTHAESNESTES
jgi:predicted transcriptional regulator